MAEFEILLHGIFDRDKIEVKRTGEFIQDPPWVSEICDKEWNKICKEKGRRGELEPTNSIISRLSGFKSGDRLSFVLGKMWYKQYIGYRAIASAMIENYGLDALPLRIGNTSVVILDGKGGEKFLLVRRTKDVTDYPYWIGAGAAGGLPINAAHLYDGMLHELEKEWSIKTEDIEEVRMTGLVADGLARNNREVTFATRVKLLPDELEAIPYTEERWEHEKQARENGRKQYGIYLPHDPVAVATFITDNDDMMMPTSQGTMVAYGRTNPFGRDGFGEGWYDSVMDTLKRKWARKAYEISVVERELSELVRRRYGLG